MAEKYKKIVIVTGGSSGIGRCTASALRDSGCIVYEFSRRNIPMEGITHDEQNGMNPEVIGKYIANIVKKKKPAIVYVASAKYKFLSLLCKILPVAVREKIVGKVYG